MKVFNQCCDTGEIPNSWKTTIIKLIPKDENNICFDTLRPLSMINVDCKLYAGVWADRMSIEAPNLINGLHIFG